MSDGGDGGDGDGVRKDSHRGSQVSEGGTPRSTAGGSSGSDSPSNLGRSTKVPSSVASATNLAIAIGSTTGAADLSGILLACREATHQLDLGVREAVSHREKCAVVLGAAVAVNIALAEAEAMHHALDSQVQTQLKRLGVGVLSVLGLAVARVQVYGKYTSAQKATRIFRYAATASKFDELRLDLEALEGQLWNLTGAVGGLGAGGTIAGGGKDHKQLGSNGKSFSGRRKKTNRTGGKNGTTSMRKLSAGPDKSRRLLRGGASHWVMGGNVRVMCAAGVDGAELWWSSNRTNRLSAFDLFLQSRRAVDAPTKGDNGNGPGSVLCMGGCFGEVTAIAAEEASALLWTGTATGEVAAWDTDVACQWGGVARVCGKNKTVAVTAIAPVASGVAWCAFSDGRLVEVSRPNRLEDDTTVRRVVCDSSQRPTGTPNDADRGGFTDLTLTVAKVSTGAVGWNGAPGSRKKDACATELIRLGPLVWASMDDMVLEAWDVDSGTCVAIAPHRDLGVCVGIAAHAAAGQVVTTHASGAVQLWCATCANGGGSAVGNRAEMVAGPNSSEGRAIGSASVDRLLVVGYRNGSMKVYVLPDRDANDAVSGLENAQIGLSLTPLGNAQSDTFSGVSVPMSPRAPRQRPAPGKIKAHRSGMTLLRAVDGTGHVGVATTGFFGSMIFWPLAELEAAVTASRLPDRRDPGAKYAMSAGGTDAEQHARRALPFTDAPVDAEALRKLAKGDKNKGLLNSKTSSLGQDTALISFTEIRLKKCVGEGSFGRVYCAVWANHTEVAVKMLGPPSAFQGNKDPLEKQRGRPTMAVGAKADAAETAAAGRAAADGRNKSVAAAAANIHKDDGAFSSADNSSDNESQDDEPEPQPEDEHVDAETLDELEKEVGIMARLRHPNIVLLLGVVRSPPAIVEEYCARGSLFSVLQRHIKPGVPALEWRVRLQMALGAAAGMCYLHNCSPPVIHRDLKSPNLMVDRYFRVKVGDFNLSRVAVAAAGGRGSTSGTTSVNPETSQGALHSPRWMAPEVLRAAKYTKASDVYSFGIVLWEIRTLKIPWASSGQWQVMHAVVEEGRRPDLDVAPNPSFEWIGEYDQLIEDAWTQEPAKRPKFERIITRLQSFIDKIAATHSGRRREVESRGTNEGSSTEVSAADGARNVGDAKPPVPPFHGTAAVPKEQNKFETPLDPNVVSLTLAEAPEGVNSVGVDDHDHGNENASGAEAERAVLRILSRKRSLKLDNVAVPKGLTLRTDAAVADLRASQEWASPTKPRKPPFAPRGSTTAAAAAVAAAAASGAAVAALEVETALAKPGRGEPLKAMSSGTSLARFQSFVSSVSKRQAFTNHPPRPQTASGRFSSVRASADAVMQSPPREGTQPVERTRPATAGQSTAAPRQSSPTSAMSPMLRAIAARKTLAPLDLHGGGFGGSGSGSASSLASSGGHRRTKTLH